MKIRTDFVTNSSSTSYVVFTVNYKNGESEETDFDEFPLYDTNYLQDLPVRKWTHDGYDFSSNEKVLDLLCSMLGQDRLDFFIGGSLTNKLQGDLDIEEVESIVIVEEFRTEQDDLIHKTTLCLYPSKGLIEIKKDK